MNRPRVLVDGVVFENACQTGIWRVFYEVMRRLAERVDFTLWLRSSPAQPVPSGVNVLRDNGRWYGPWSCFPRRAWAELSRRFPRCGGIRPNVFHSTYFTPCPVSGASVVTTVYDMIAEQEILTDDGNAWDANVCNKRASIHSARVCVAISASTASDLCAHFPEAAPRVRIISLGTEHLRAAPVRTAGNGQHALFVGNRGGYKNFSMVLSAMSCAAWPKHVVLRVVGEPLNDQEQHQVRQHGLMERIVQAGRVSDDQLAAEYATAACFVFPSRREGFGLPIVEAQINGCPVVCSDIPVFREVGGAATLRFDPGSGERLAAAVATTCEPGERLRLTEAGVQNARRFSWDRAAEQMLEVYRELAESKD
jgi:glycosyltransferase involved in cell wall biosynthesis